MINEEIIDVISRAKYEGNKCVNIESKRKGVAQYKPDSIPLWNFNNYEYRIIEEPEMIPLDFTDILDIMNKWLVDGRDKSEGIATKYVSFDSYPSLFIQFRAYGGWYTFQDLQKYFTFKDTGAKLEKEKK